MKGCTKLRERRGRQRRREEERVLWEEKRRGEKEERVLWEERRGRREREENKKRTQLGRTVD